MNVIYHFDLGKVTPQLEQRIKEDVEAVCEGDEKPLNPTSFVFHLVRHNGQDYYVRPTNNDNEIEVFYADIEEHVLDKGPFAGFTVEVPVPVKKVQ